MKIWVLTENTPYAPEFAAEHGLSLYVETAQHKLLFDSGQTAAFAENAEKLGVDLGQVDLAVLSHGHYDHGGGLGRFLELNDHAPVYMSRLAFGSYYNGQEKYIGLDPQLLKSGRLILTGDREIIDEELSLCSCNDRNGRFPPDSAGLTEKTEEGFRPDRFLHEQYLTIRENGRKIVFSGCSHKGVLNIVDWTLPDVFVGGFHFMKQEVASGENPVLDQAAHTLLSYPAEYYTCHCTGTEQYAYLKVRMGERLHSLNAGQVLSI